MTEQVILVDENDVEIGFAEKMEAHQKALLHRAFSVFLFNDKGEMLIHQRANEKYHSGGLWTNTCCGHPRPYESIDLAANRRMKEEMGIVCPIENKFSFMYKAILDNELTENEIDHVFVGIFNGTPELNESEVQKCKWISVEALRTDVKTHPAVYTEWFKICFEDVLSKINSFGK